MAKLQWWDGFDEIFTKVEKKLIHVCIILKMETILVIYCLAPYLILFSIQNSIFLPLFMHVIAILPSQYGWIACDAKIDVLSYALTPCKKRQPYWIFFIKIFIPSSLAY